MLAAEWTSDNIGVNALEPSIIMTKILARAVEPSRLEILKLKMAGLALLPELHDTDIESLKK